MRVDPHNLRVVASIDPASSVLMRGQSSRMAIACVGADPEGRIFVLDAWAERTSTQSFVDRIFETAAKYSPQPFGCEVNALQRLFSDTTQMLARAKGIRLNLQAVKQPLKIDKDTRIRLILQPIIAYGRLFLRKDQVKLRDEILSFPQSHQKDLVDVLATAINLLPATLLANKDTSLEAALTAYHKSVGTPVSMLDYRMKQLRGEHPEATPARGNHRW